MSVILAFSLAAAASPSNSLSLEAIHNFGACVAKTTPKGARELLAMDFDSPDYREKLNAFGKGHGRCINPGWTLKSSGVLFAGALAEALLHSKSGPAELQRQLVDIPRQTPVQSRSETETMALCAVMHAPQVATELFATEPASREERDALAKVTATLPDCLRKDMKLSLNAPALRALVALAAWRIVATAEPAK